MRTTHMKTMIKGLGTLLLALAATSCGSGLNSSSTGGGTTSSSTTVLMGNGSGSSFVAGTLGLTSGTLSAGGSTTVTVNLQYSNGTPYTASTVITFISACFQSNLAQFTVTGSTAPTNTVTTTTGQATVTYSATGCSGTDTITASATSPNSGGGTLTATGTVTVATAIIGTIEWVSTTPADSQISLAGAGGKETATVVFKVTDTTGGPVANQTVNFSLETFVGGLSLTPQTQVTGTDGTVQTVVHSGTEHGSVRVKATTVTKKGVSIFTVSPGIVISTGIPTQDRFSLSLSNHDVEGLDIDGITVTATVRLADRFGNPAPDGTTVSFTTNGGHIDPSCITTGATGTCSVTWTSAAPRPTGTDGLSVTGHAEILAYTTGEEHFKDVNGDGVFDNTDTFKLFTTSFDTFTWLQDSTIDDIGEVYLDGLETGTFKSGEFYFDFNGDHVRNAPNHKYHGTGCVGTASVVCDPNSTTLGIGQQDCVVMAGTGLTIKKDDLTTSQTHGTTALYDVYDANGNAPPAGTKFSIKANNGATVSVLQGTANDTSCLASPPGFDVNGLGNGKLQISVSVDPTSISGDFFIEATTPSGLISYSPDITVL